MAQVGSCLPVTLQARAQSQSTQCGICGGECGTGMGFTANALVFPYHCHLINSTVYIFANISSS